MKATDFFGLPEPTIKFVTRLQELGFDRDRVFGLFVLVGLYAGSPKPKDEVESLFSRIQTVLPVDRSKNIDEVIGHVYGGYDREINEFCYRSGLTDDYFRFREMKVPNVDRSFYVAYLKDEGLLTQEVQSVEKLHDAGRLYDSFLLALGSNTIKNNANLLEAFQCGVFQIQLHATSDVQGSVQISRAISSLMPPQVSRCFQAVVSAQIEYFLGLEFGQLALLSLMQEMKQDYAQQMWGFQSSLFFRDGQTIDGVNDLNQQQWHAWVLQNAVHFSEAYPDSLLPFSSANVTLHSLPTWGGTVESFEDCDHYIQRVWGYASESLQNDFESYEYKALMVHVVYSSLTSAREVMH